RMNPLEELEPELRVEPAGVVLDERQLRPAHGPGEPVAPGLLLRLAQPAKHQPGAGRGGCGHELTSRNQNRHQRQNMYFVASWITRSPFLLVINPNEPLVGLLFAPPQFGWFSALNASTRSSTRWLPRMGTSLRRPMSRFQVCGLRSELRGCAPKVPAAGRANAAGLNHVAVVVNGVRSIDVSPTTFQNWLPLPGPMPAKSSLLRTENGEPDWNWYTPVTSQCPSARDFQPVFSRRNGSS